MNWQVVIPHIGPKNNLQQCIDSMGKIVVPVLIVDNSKSIDTRAMNLPKGIAVEEYPQNIGVAASWNRGLARWAKWTVISSASIRFNGLKEFITQANWLVSGYGLNCGLHSPFHLYIVGRKTIDKIGTFDENFYPAECEDLDYGTRMRLSGVWEHIPVEGMDVSCVGDNLSGVFIRDIAPKCREIREDYLLRKWGPNVRERGPYPFPFNDSTKKLDYWVNENLYQGVK